MVDAILIVAVVLETRASVATDTAAVFIYSE